MAQKSNFKKQKECEKKKANNRQTMNGNKFDILKLQDKKVEIIPVLANELTEDQISEFRNAFSLFDKDEDGRITICEMTKVMRALGQNPSEREVNEMITSVDCDGNGSIEFSEFLVLMANKLSTEDLSEEVKNAFRIFDKDNDGIMSASDIRDMLQNYGEKMSLEEIEEFLAIADKNGDGKINYSEFASHLELEGMPTL